MSQETLKIMEQNAHLRYAHMLLQDGSQRGRSLTINLLHDFYSGLVNPNTGMRSIDTPSIQANFALTASNGDLGQLADGFVRDIQGCNESYLDAYANSAVGEVYELSQSYSSDAITQFLKPYEARTVKELVEATNKGKKEDKENAKKALTIVNSLDALRLRVTVGVEADISGTRQGLEALVKSNNSE